MNVDTYINISEAKLELVAFIVRGESTIVDWYNEQGTIDIEPGIIELSDITEFGKISQDKFLDKVKEVSKNDNGFGCQKFLSAEVYVYARYNTTIPELSVTRAIEIPCGDFKIDFTKNTIEEI